MKKLRVSATCFIIFFVMTYSGFSDSFDTFFYVIRTSLFSQTGFRNLVSSLADILTYAIVIFGTLIIFIDGLKKYVKYLIYMLYAKAVLSLISVGFNILYFSEPIRPETSRILIMIITNLLFAYIFKNAGGLLKNQVSDVQSPMKMGLASLAIMILQFIPLFENVEYISYEIMISQICNIMWDFIFLFGVCFLSCSIYGEGLHFGSVAIIAMVFIVLLAGSEPTSAGSGRTNTCGVCGRTFQAGDTGGNYMNIAKTNMCKRCKKNFDYANKSLGKIKGEHTWTRD